MIRTVRRNRIVIMGFLAVSVNWKRKVKNKKRESFRLKERNILLCFWVGTKRWTWIPTVAWTCRHHAKTKSKKNAIITVFKTWTLPKLFLHGNYFKCMFILNVCSFKMYVDLKCMFILLVVVVRSVSSFIYIILIFS